MKTSQSFFPTRTQLKSREARHERTYQLIKKQEESPEGNSPDQANFNIFREAQAQPRTENDVQRPVGGTELFKRMEQAGRERANENRRHSKRSNKEPTQRNISSFNNNRFRRDRPESDDRENQQESALNRPISEIPHNVRLSLPEETFKSHMAYMPHSVSVKSHTRESHTRESGFRPGRSEVLMRPATSKPFSRTEAWAAEQRREYQDKAALLNEISYNKPLVEIYGDRYFEFMLRNRFEEDLRPPAYIYQVGRKAADSRVVERIKKYRPDIRQKPMMVVRGKRVSCEDA